jgi:glycogen debranching enzyme
MRYGHVAAAHRVTEGLVAAAGSFQDRLPELFAGLSRATMPVPVSYPTSCSPQAWAAAAPLLLLRSLLRLEPDARAGRLCVAPDLPEWLGLVRLERVPILGGHLSLDAEGRRCRVVAAPDGIDVTGDLAPAPS